MARDTLTRGGIVLLVAFALGATVVAPATGAPQASTRPFSIEQILAPAYPFDLVSARSADRLAWIAYERGMRNVYTAAAPDFDPVRLTDNLQDDGNDLSDLRISDDGSVLAFVRGHAPNGSGWVANPTSDPRGGERSIWTVSTTGGEPRRLAAGGAPALSPDGKWVLFARDGQIYRAAVESRAPGAQPDPGEAPVALVWGSNRGPVWSPDSSRFAFVSDRGDHAFIGVYDLRTAEVSYLAPGVDRDTSPTWSPDGKRVAFIRRPGASFGQQLSGGRGNFQGGSQQRPQGDSAPEPRAGLDNATFAGGYGLSLWVVDVDSGSGREFWHNAPDDTDFAAMRAIEWAGGSVIFQVERDNWRHVWSTPVPDLEPAPGRDATRTVRGGARSASRAGGWMLEDPPAPVDLTPGQGIAEYWGLSGDGGTLYWAGNRGDIDRRHIWATPTSGGTPVQLTRGDTIETYPAALASGDKVAVLSATERQPLSVALVNSAGGAAEVLFPELGEDFPAAQQVVPENVVLTAADGVQFHNQVFVPAGIRPGERRPAVLFTHGGPIRQMLLGYHYMHFYHMAYAINQYLASQGYVVISVNYRSGIGYGREFRMAEGRGRQGNTEYADVLAAGQYLQGRDDVDPARIGLWGLSYGGVLTAQGLARNSDIFAAGVDIAGVHLWGNSIEPDNVGYQSSAIAAIEGWTSPVLLIHGDDDRNVDFAQTTGLVQLLRAHDVYHELIVFPDDVHDSLLFDRWLLAFNAMDEFFARFLRAEPVTESGQ